MYEVSRRKTSSRVREFGSSRRKTWPQALTGDSAPVVTRAMRAEDALVWSSIASERSRINAANARFSERAISPAMIEEDRLARMQIAKQQRPQPVLPRRVVRTTAKQKISQQDSVNRASRLQNRLDNLLEKATLSSRDVSRIIDAISARRFALAQRLLSSAEQKVNQPKPNPFYPRSRSYSSGRSSFTTSRRSESSEFRRGQWATSDQVSRALGKLDKRIGRVVVDSLGGFSYGIKDKKYFQKTVMGKIRQVQNSAKQDRLIMPMVLNIGAHWTGLVMIYDKHANQLTAYYTNSLGGTNMPGNIAKDLKAIARRMRIPLKINGLKTPQQPDGWSCGPRAAANVSQIVDATQNNKIPDLVAQAA